jgi:hypothetical protein
MCQNGYEPNQPPDETDIELASDADLNARWAAEHAAGECDSPPPRTQITVEEAQAATKNS